MDVQPKNLRDVILSIWVKISEEGLQCLVESILQRLKVVQKGKRGSDLQ